MGSCPQPGMRVRTGHCSGMAGQSGCRGQGQITGYMAGTQEIDSEDSSRNWINLCNQDSITGGVRISYAPAWPMFRKIWNNVCEDVPHWAGVVGAGDSCPGERSYHQALQTMAVQLLCNGIQRGSWRVWVANPLHLLLSHLHHPLYLPLPDYQGAEGLEEAWPDSPSHVNCQEIDIFIRIH